MIKEMWVNKKKTKNLKNLLLNRYWKDERLLLSTFTESRSPERRRAPSTTTQRMLEIGGEGVVEKEGGREEWWSYSLELCSYNDTNISVNIRFRPLCSFGRKKKRLINKSAHNIKKLTNIKWSCLSFLLLNSLFSWKKKKFFDTNFFNELYFIPDQEKNSLKQSFRKGDGEGGRWRKQNQIKMKSFEF